MLLKEIIELQTALTGIKNDVSAAGDPTAEIAAAQAVIDKLRQELVGSPNTVYTYKCKNPMCGNKCVLKVNCLLSDLKFCIDSLSSGNGQFEQTNIEVIPIV
jgi:hypothetical protein